MRAKFHYTLLVHDLEAIVATKRCKQFLAPRCSSRQRSSHSSLPFLRCLIHAHLSLLQCDRELWTKRKGKIENVRIYFGGKVLPKLYACLR